MASPRKWGWAGWAVVVVAVAGGLVWWTVGRRASPPSEGELSSLVVLPFVNLSSDQQDEYFSDGLTEDLINALAKVEPLRVVASTSAFAFKGKPQDVREIGAKLKVRAVREGTVRKAGDRLRITAQLMSAADGYHVWSATYDRQMTDLFAVQDEISRAIVNALRIKLAGDRPPPVKRSTESVEAYHLYLLGYFYRRKQTPGGTQKGIEYFERAVQVDPGYAAAYAGLADAFASLGGLNLMPPREAYPRAEAAARKALELDADLPEAHLALAHLSAHRWDWSGAEKEFRRVFDVDPTRDHRAHAMFYLVPMGRLEEAIREVKRSLELDPLSVAANRDLGVLYYMARRYDESIQQLHQTLEMEPNYGIARLDLGRSYLEKGMFAEAIAEFLQRPVQGPGGLWNLAIAYARAGRTAEAEKLLGQLQEPFRHGKILAANMAKVYAALGDKDQAFAYLESAYERRDVPLTDLKVHPLFDPLRSDPRYTDLLRRMGLAP